MQRSRDESLHFELCSRAYKEVMKDKTMSKEAVNEIISNSVEIQISFVEQSFPESNGLKEYIKECWKKLEVMLDCEESDKEK